MLEGINVDVVILGGITFAGFNMIDPRVINEKTGLPVIIYSGVEPNNELMLTALKKHFKDWERRWKIVASLGTIHRIQTLADKPEVYFEVVGCKPDWAKEVLKTSAVVSRIPEPVRAARRIAKGLSQTS